MAVVKRVSVLMSLRCVMRRVDVDFAVNFDTLY